MMKLEIDRARWRTGTFCDFDGRKCAMGWYLAAKGVDPNVMRFIVRSNWSSHSMKEPWEAEVYKVNDSHNLQKDIRECGLVELFARQGCELTFIGDYRD